MICFLLWIECEVFVDDEYVFVWMVGFCLL